MSSHLERAYARTDTEKEARQIAKMWQHLGLYDVRVSQNRPSEFGWRVTGYNRALTEDEIAQMRARLDEIDRIARQEAIDRAMA